jgi:hypothetical protein
MLFGKNRINKPFSPLIKNEDKLFADIYGYDNIKILFIMALDIILHLAPDMLSSYPSIVKREGPEGEYYLTLCFCHISSHSLEVLMNELDNNRALTYSRCNPLY